jgi:tetratricopeptide (TPR) repeat protein
MHSSRPKGVALDLSQLEPWYKVAGIGGIAIGAVVLFISGITDKTSSLPAQQRASTLRLLALGAFGVGALGIVAWVANGWSGGQHAPTRGDDSPAIISGGNVTISPSLIAGRDTIVTYGLTPEQVQELTKAAVSGAAGQLADSLTDLSSRLGVTEGATRTILGILNQRDVPLEQLPQKLAEVANEYKKLEAQLTALNPQNPLARSLVEQAQAEFRAGSMTKVGQLLSQAKQAQIAAAQQARELRQKALGAEDELLIHAAASSEAEGDLAITKLQYLQAADLFKEAANLVPPGSAYDDKRIGYLQKEARAFYHHGDEFGDNSALNSAIERNKRLIDLQPRERVPLAWAATQDNLGIALRALGERESGTARLEEAIAAYREALKERTRERVPLDWALSTGNQGVASMVLAERGGNLSIAENALAEITVAFETFRDAHHALEAAYYEAQLPAGRALVERLRKG